MNKFTSKVIADTSVPLSGGGDAHFHPWDNGRGFTATTRLPGNLDFHQDFRFSEMFSQRTPTRPDVLRYMQW